MDRIEALKLRQEKGRIYHIETFGAVDGPGIRFIAFLQGCPMRCLYCHNPDSLPVQGGTERTAGDLTDEAMRYIHFIKRGGVTFSGGEPLLQPAFVRAASLLLKEKGLHIAIDTSGCIDPRAPKIKAAIDAVDMLLLDIKAADDDTAIGLTGHPLKNAFETLKVCEEEGKPVWVRHVLLEGYTLDEGKIRRLGERLKPFTCIERIELLPFHKLGEPKWAETNYDYKLADTPATTRAQTEAAKALLREQGLPIH